MILKLYFIVVMLLISIFESRALIDGEVFNAIGEAVEGAVAATAVAADLTSKVFDGASLIGSSINQIAKSADTARSCAIEIRNYHKDIELTEPHVFVERGNTQVPPSPEISPGFKEACLFRKTHGPATGSYGVLTYRINKVLTNGRKSTIESDGTTLTLMWGVPWAWEYYSNYQAVGISDSPVSMNYDLFAKMYYKTGSDFVRSEALKTIFFEKVVYKSIPIRITTTMNDESRATWIININ